MLLFMRGRKTDLNIRGAFLHMAADALVSLGVVIGGALYLWRGFSWIDPVMSLLIAALIVVGTWSLFRQSLHLLFDGVPEGIDLAAVRKQLQSHVADLEVLVQLVFGLVQHGIQVGAFLAQHQMRRQRGV